VTSEPALAAVAHAALDVGAHALRLVPVVALCPFLGGPLLPPAARAALAFALGAVARLAGGRAPIASSGPGLVGLVASEVGLGVVLAVAASLPVEAARGAGRLVDTLRGATLGELHVAPVRQRETALGDLLAWWTIALGAWAGADRLLVGALLDTYRAIPVGSVPALRSSAGAAADAAAALLRSALALGAPAAALLLCVELALAAASRVAPRLGMLDAAAPVRAALGMAAVLVAAGATGGRLAEIASGAAALVRLLAAGAP
jgi:type III secretory pathway component EscT